MSSVAYQRTYYDKYLRASRGYVAKVDRAPVATRIQECREVGMSIQGIADAAGVSYETVWRIIQHPEGKVTQAIRRRILAVIPRRPVTRHGLMRRVQALSRLGWTATQIADAAGCDMSTIKRWRRGLIEIPGPTTEGIVRAYDALSMRIPTPVDRYERTAASRVTGDAVRAGWPPPLAWDDDEIDDPFARPADEYVPLEDLPVIDQIRALEAEGFTRDEIAERRQVSRDAIDMAISRSMRKAS